MELVVNLKWNELKSAYLKAKQERRDREEARNARYRLVVVKRPKGWSPAEWSDTPPNAKQLWVEERGLTHEHATDIQFGFNAASMSNRGRTWCLVQPDLGSTAGSKKPKGWRKWKRHK